jgi:hypothetical protein
MLGTPGNDTLIDTGVGDWIIGFDGNDAVFALGGSDTVTEGDGNDQITFSGSGGDVLYAGNGTDAVALSLYSSDNRVILGFGVGDTISGSAGHDYIVAPGNYASVDGMGGSDTIVLGGRHDKVVERYGGFDGLSDHNTADRIYGFNHSDRIAVEGFGKHPSWHQGHRGVLFVDHKAVALVVDHHLTAHDLIFV